MYYDKEEENINNNEEEEELQNESSEELNNLTVNNKSSNKLPFGKVSNGKYTQNSKYIYSNNDDENETVELNNFNNSEQKSESKNYYKYERKFDSNTTPQTFCLNKSSEQKLNQNEDEKDDYNLVIIDENKIAKTEFDSKGSISNNINNNNSYHSNKERTINRCLNFAYEEEQNIEKENLKINEIRNSKRNNNLYEDNLERNLVHLYSQWSIYGYFFLIKKLDTPSIDEEYLSSFINSLTDKISKNINSNLKKSFITIITEDRYFIYKIGNEIRASKKELEKMKKSTQQKLKEENDLSKVFLNQISNLEYIIDPEDDVIPGWEDDPYPIDDPDDLDDPQKYDDNQKDIYPTNPKKEFHFGKGFYLTVIVCLILLIFFLVWLFYSLAKRVKKMNSEKIDYNMFTEKI